MGKKWPNNRLGQKRIEIKGEKKGGEMHIFTPIDLKSTKKRLLTFWLRRTPHTFQLGQKYKSRRGVGQKYEFPI